MTGSGWIVFIGVLFITGFIALLFFMDGKQDKILLNKDEWECTNTESFTTMILVGKTVVPASGSRCIKWESK